MSGAMKRTPLYDWHVENGGNMVEFGDYVMPLWYGSAKAEHLGVLSHAGAFDTSHMASVMIRGKGAFDLIQRCFTRDLHSCVGKNGDPISIGRCVYGAFLNEKGECIDDTIIYKIADEEYMAVVNAGMGGAIAAHLNKEKKGLAVTLEDLTDRLGKFDIQGPNSVKIMRKVLKNPDAVFDKMVYFSFKGHFDKNAASAGDVCLKDGTPFLLSRSGYTGEVGFEIFVNTKDVRKTFETIMEAGKELGLIPCGLASRDSLRTGAFLPLSHQDIGAWLYLNHPWGFALPFDQNGSFTKEFIGSKALVKGENATFTIPFAGFDLRKVDAHGSKVLDENGKEIGEVLTCATDIAIGRSQGKIYSVNSPNPPSDLKIKGLCCGFVKVKKSLPAGTPLVITDGKRKLDVQVESDIRPDRTARSPIKNFM